MRNMLYIIWGSLCLLLVISGCKSTDGAKAPVSLTWKMGAVEVQPGYYENSFVLKNISDVPLERIGSSIIRSCLVRFCRKSLLRSKWKW